jgi:hypothetical protein
VADTFRAGHPDLDPDRDLDGARELLDEARSELRGKFIDADIGLTGANMLIAETGSSVIVTNEGNGDLTQILPRAHIVLASIEKVVPTLEDALLEVCGGAPRPPRTAPLFGRVIDVSGRPQAGREVRLAWLDTGAFEPQLLAIPPGRPQGEPAGEWRVASEGDLATLKALTDQRGIFMLCDVPFGSRVRLDVAMADGVSVSRRPLVRPGIAVAVVVVTIAEGAPRRAPRLP